MMQRSQQKNSILHYLPENQRAKLMKLIERLAEETAEKQKYKGLYEQIQQRYEKLVAKYEQLEQYTLQLKSQIATSRMAINKAKQVYIASKSSRKQNKKINNNNFENSDEQWETVGFTDDNNKEALKKWQNQTNQNQRQTAKPTQNFTTRSRQFVFEDSAKSKGQNKSPGDSEEEQSENDEEKYKNTFKTNGNHKSVIRPPLPYQRDAHEQTERSLKKSKMTSAKKIPYCDNSSFVVGSGSKKDEINNLKREIESLTQSMQKKKRSEMPYNEKMKRCEEIKNRYMKSKEKYSQKNVESMVKVQRQRQYSAESSGSEESYGLIKSIKEKTQKYANDKSYQNSSQKFLSKKNIKEKDRHSQKIFNTSEIEEQSSHMTDRKRNSTKILENKGRRNQNKNEASKMQYDQSLFDVIAALNP